MPGNGFKRLAVAAIFFGLLVSMAAGYFILRRLRETPSAAGDRKSVV